MGEAVHLGKAEAGALADRLGREERLEDLVEHIGGNAEPGISDIDPDELAGVRRLGLHDVARADRHRAAVGHGIAGIDDEIEQGGFELGDVGLDRPDVAVDVEGQTHRAADAGIEHLADRFDAGG